MGKQEKKLRKNGEKKGYCKVLNNVCLISFMENILFIKNDKKICEKIKKLKDGEYLVETTLSGVKIFIKKPGKKGKEDIIVLEEIPGKKKKPPSHHKLFKFFHRKWLENRKVFELVKKIYENELEPSEMEFEDEELEYLLKVLKWIFAQEENNYPPEKGYMGKKQTWAGYILLVNGFTPEEVVRTLLTRRFFKTR